MSISPSSLPGQEVGEIEVFPWHSDNPLTPFDPGVHLAARIHRSEDKVGHQVFGGCSPVSEQTVSPVAKATCQVSLGG